MTKSEQKLQKQDRIVVDSAIFGEDVAEGGGEIGSVQIHNSVIAAIARIAALKVPGVCEMSGSLLDGIAAVVGTKKTTERGINVEVQDDSVTLELHVIVNFGVHIPHVAYQIQTEVRRAVEQMTGKTVRSVQVVVQGVRMPAEGAGELKRETRSA